MSTPQKLVYVDLPVVEYQKFALVVTDENDLKEQIVKHEQTIRAQAFQTKAKRNKNGTIEFFDLNQDWNKT